MVPCREMRAWRHLQYLSDELDTKFSSLNDVVLVAVEGINNKRYWRPGSDPRKPAALLKIFFARLVSCSHCSIR